MHIDKCHFNPSTLRKIISAAINIEELILANLDSNAIDHLEPMQLSKLTAGSFFYCLNVNIITALVASAIH